MMGKHFGTGQLVPGYHEREDVDLISATLSRGEVHIGRIAYDAMGDDLVRELNGGDTHIYVVEADGSVTDTEAADRTEEKK